VDSSVSAQDTTGGETANLKTQMRLWTEKLRSLATGEVIGQTDVAYLEGKGGLLWYTGVFPSGQDKTDGYTDYQDLRVHVVKADPANLNSFGIEGKGLRGAGEFSIRETAFISGLVLLGGTNARLTMAEGVKAIRLQGVLIKRNPQADVPDSYVTWSRDRGIYAIGNGYAVGRTPEAGVALPTNLLPRHPSELVGTREVRIRNPNGFAVLAGIRSGDRGANLTIPANAQRSAYVPDGRYDIFFVYSNKSDALFQGDSFTLKGSGVEIKIVKVVGGNYGIRQVK